MHRLTTSLVILWQIQMITSATQSGIPTSESNKNPYAMW